MEKKKILVFTGAGVSKESGIATFRDGKNSTWNNYNIEEVATFDGWKKDKTKVLGFYNERRAQLKDVVPNLAHLIIKELENDFDVLVVTQNVDDLHERAGSTNIVHLHGELLKSRSTLDSKLVYDCPGDINIGDKCERGSQLRPHIVWFGENLNISDTNKALDFAFDCDVCIIVGSSMQVAPANTIPFETKENCLIYYIDPGDGDIFVPKRRKIFFYHIKEIATKGMELVKNELIDIFTKNETDATDD